jgi:hypothetical protein
MRPSRPARGAATARACSLLDDTPSPSPPFRNNFDSGIVAHPIVSVI